VKIVALIKPLVLTMLAVSVVAACARSVDRAPGHSASDSPSADTNCRLIEHQRGETEICGQPERIVVLGSPMLELLLALDIQPAGYGDHFAAYQGVYDNPSQRIPYLGSRVTSQPVNVGSAFNPSLESIVKAQPDLIVVTEYNEAQYQAFSKLAPTLLLNWFDAATNLRTLARVVGRSEKAEELIAKQQQQITNAQKDFAPVVKAHPRVLTLGTSDLSEIFLMTETNGFCASLIQDLGFQLVYPPGVNGDDSSAVPPISLETLPQLNGADSIFIFGQNQDQVEQIDRFKEHHLKKIEQAWKANAIAQSLRASKAGRVYFVPTYLCLGLPGPIGVDLYLNELQEQLLPD
jgi:iron complex transport system substrate-binding protein